MPRFLFDFRQGQDLTADADGIELVDAEHAYLEAFEAAREMWSELLKQRRDPRRCSFEVRNETGELLFEVPFREILESCHDRGHRFEMEHTMRQLQETHQRAQRIKQEFAMEIEMSRLTLLNAAKLLKQPH